MIEASPPAGALKRHETSVHADFQALYRENETELKRKKITNKLGRRWSNAYESCIEIKLLQYICIMADRDGKK